METKTQTSQKAALQQEQLLIQKAKKNPKDFEPIYNKYHEAIFRFVFQRTGNKENSFDITSKIFLKALTKLNTYQFRGVPFSAWLFRIAFNEVNQAFREQKAEWVIYGEIAQFDQIMENNEHKYSEKDYEKLKAAITQLPQEDIQLIELRFFESRSFAEIGIILNITENNAKTRSYRILKKLNHLISK